MYILPDLFSRPRAATWPEHWAACKELFTYAILSCLVERSALNVPDTPVGRLVLTPLVALEQAGLVHIQPRPSGAHRVTATLEGVLTYQAYVDHTTARSQQAVRFALRDIETRHAWEVRALKSKLRGKKGKNGKKHRPHAAAGPRGLLRELEAVLRGV